jgi:hypothetical protein
MFLTTLIILVCSIVGLAGIAVHDGLKPDHKVIIAWALGMLTMIALYFVRGL